jgi:hypothetical protein
MIIQTLFTVAGTSQRQLNMTDYLTSTTQSLTLFSDYTLTKHISLCAPIHTTHICNNRFQIISVKSQTEIRCFHVMLNSPNTVSQLPSSCRRKRGATSTTCTGICPSCRRSALSILLSHPTYQRVVYYTPIFNVRADDSPKVSSTSFDATLLSTSVFRYSETSPEHHLFLFCFCC